MDFQGGEEWEEPSFHPFLASLLGNVPVHTRHSHCAAPAVFSRRCFPALSCHCPAGPEQMKPVPQKGLFPSPSPHCSPKPWAGWDPAPNSRQEQPGISGLDKEFLPVPEAPLAPNPGLETLRNLLFQFDPRVVRDLFSLGFFFFLFVFLFILF